MTAPAGLCESCGMPMQWTFMDTVLMVRCEYCFDFFGSDPGTEVAGEYREGREAVMPDGRPIRSTVQIAANDAYREEGR